MVSRGEFLHVHEKNLYSAVVGYCFINVNHTKLEDSAHVLYVLDFLAICPISYWENSAEDPNSS